MNHIMAVCDEEEYYAAKLADYLNLKEHFPFEVIHFTDIGRMKAFMEKNRPDIILVNEESAESVLKFSAKEQIIFLSKTGISNENNYKCVYKYQSCEKIIQQILTMMAERNVSSTYVSRKNGLKIIGFYTPVKRSYQTTAALIAGELLSKLDKVLYMNLEAFSGLPESLGLNFEKELSDLLYYIQNKKKGIQYLLGGISIERNGLSILPPMSCQMDLISILTEEWIQLLKELERYSDYEYLILDLSDSIQGLFEILRQCFRIYTIIQNDEIAVAKIKQYEEELKKCSYEDVISKSRYCQLNEKANQNGSISNQEISSFFKKYIQEDIYDR